MHNRNYTNNYSIIFANVSDQKKGFDVLKELAEQNKINASITQNGSYSGVNLGFEKPEEYTRLMDAFDVHAQTLAELSQQDYLDRLIVRAERLGATIPIQKTSAMPLLEWQVIHHDG